MRTLMANTMMDDHVHEVIDQDTHFLIDPATRTIKNATECKRKIVQFDHDSERLTFELPRYVDGHDMLSCNVVQVHYLNIEAKGGAVNKGVYEVDDLQECPGNSENISCSWLISSNATQYVGSLSFIVRFVCSSDGSVEYAWNTEVYSGITVANGINNGDSIAEIYPDILEQWKNEFSYLIATGLENAKASLSNEVKADADAAKAAAKSMSFVSFVIEEDGNLYICNSELLGSSNFSLNTDGNLEVEI